MDNQDVLNNFDSDPLDTHAILQQEEYEKQHGVITDIFQMTFSQNNDMRSLFTILTFDDGTRIAPQKWFWDTTGIITVNEEYVKQEEWLKDYRYIEIGIHHDNLVVLSAYKTIQAIIDTFDNDSLKLYNKYEECETLWQWRNTNSN